MNWYKQQSLIQKEAWDWQRFQKGFWAGAALALAGWLGLSQLEVQRLQSELGNDEEVVQVLREEVQKQGGNPEQIIQENPTEVVQEESGQEVVQPAPTRMTAEEEQTEGNPESAEQDDNHYYDMYIDRLEQREGNWTHAYDDRTSNEYNGGPRRGVITIGVGHAMGANPTDSDRHAPRSQRVFQELFGNSVNWNDVYHGRAELTEEQVAALARYDIEEHVQRAIRLLPQYETYPEYVQEALLDSVFRGDTGQRTAALINQGNWRAAADEYINRMDYINAERNNMRGIKIRMDRNRAAMLRYAEELGQ